jgi:GNAT superfamily N-acetyltransferase
MDNLMCDEWMPKLALPLTGDQYSQLPRNSAYQYDLVEGIAHLTPRPRYFHGVMSFARRRVATPAVLSPDVYIRPVLGEDQTFLAEVFADAFAHGQPFGSLTRTERLIAARVTLAKTFAGGDGPWLRDASFAAISREDGKPFGAMLITLVPGGDAGNAECYRWSAPPPDNLRACQPHLTWVFVTPVWQDRGMASALLARAADALANSGYTSLWSTFLLGNDESMLWHWRNGFELAPYPLSRRVWPRNSA